MNYEYSITGLKRQDFDGFPNTIVGVHWRLTGTDIENYSGFFIGYTKLQEFTGDVSSFIDFDSLLEEQVIDWIRPIVEADSEYMTHIYQRIDKSIDKQKWQTFDSSRDFSLVPWDERKIPEEEQTDTL